MRDRLMEDTRPYQLELSSGESLSKAKNQEAVWMHWSVTEMDKLEFKLNLFIYLNALSVN